MWSILFNVTVIVGLFTVTCESKAVAERFFPKDLEQDGKITLTPTFTPDGQQIYFAQSECFPIWECPQTLKTSYKSKTGWSKPEPVELPIEARVDWPYVTPDGRYLLFSWSAPREEYEGLDIYENFDLYRLDLTEKGATPEPLKGADINRPRAGSVKKLRYVHNEAYPSMTKSGDLYFMTERLDGVGERDIYVAKASSNGQFSKAEPLPFPINTSQRDDGVWVNPTGDLMLLTYNNRGGFGDADIFVSIKRDEKWQKPINIGSLVNTKYAEFGAKLSPDEQSILFSSNRPVDGKVTDSLQVWVAKFDKTLYF
jgi:Tol biopolymer transport system component